VSSPILQGALRRLIAGQTLDAAEAADAFGAVMRGEGTAAQMAALLMGLRVRGERPSEIAGAAQALRNAMTRLEALDPDALVDTCGTGGGTLSTFNISTAAAILAAGAGVRVAKHGNRSFTSRSGSADILEALGVAIDVPVSRMGEVLDEAGIVFMFAPTMHPAMRHVGPVRREMGIPTVMNLVGPLANPAAAGRQVIGVADPDRMPLIAGALQSLGTVHALVVHGAPGLDELSPLGPSDVIEIRGQDSARWTFDPASVGIREIPPEDLAGGDPADNARLVEQVLHGDGTVGAVAAVVLNAGAAIYVAGKARDLKDGVELAREALVAGRGAEALDRLRRASAARRPPVQ
jgi:anthranilate phosphoribosyltransferase